MGKLHMALTCHSEEVSAGIQETWLPPGYLASGHQDSTFHQDSYQSWQQSLRTESSSQNQKPWEVQWGGGGMEGNQMNPQVLDWELLGGGEGMSQEKPQKGTVLVSG